MKTYNPAPGIVYVVPEGRRELQSVFGVPNTFRCHLAEITLPSPVQERTVITCNPAAKDAFTLAFQRIHDAGLWGNIRQMGNAYENSPRHLVFPSMLSMRQFGAGIILNQPSNRPGYSPASERVRNSYVATTMPGVDDGETIYDDSFFYPDHPIVQIFKELGFSWGGDRRKPHVFPGEFELVQGY